MAQTITPSSGSPSPRTPKPVRKPARVQLPYPLNLMQTAVGRKWIMALSGIGLIGFVLAHMAGNFHLLEGQLETAHYAEVLREIGAPVIPHKWFLWALRLGLIAMFGVHIFSARSLQEMSRKANPKSNLISSNKTYAGSQDFIAANYASRTMRWTGPIILLYLIWHLMDLTWGWVNPDFVAGDPYHNVEASLSNIPIAIVYVLANVALAVHVFHGTWSLFASLGVAGPKVNLIRKPLAALLAGVILVGNLSFPIMTQLGVIDDTDEIVQIDDAGHLELIAEP